MTTNGQFRFGRERRNLEDWRRSTPTDDGKPTQSARITEDEFEWAKDGSKLLYVDAQLGALLRAAAERDFFGPSSAGEITEVARITGTSQSISHDGGKSHW